MHLHGKLVRYRASTSNRNTAIFQKPGTTTRSTGRQSGVFLSILSTEYEFTGGLHEYNSI